MSTSAEDTGPTEFGESLVELIDREVVYALCDALGASDNIDADWLRLPALNALFEHIAALRSTDVQPAEPIFYVPIYRIPAGNLATGPHGMGEWRVADGNNASTDMEFAMGAVFLRHTEER